MGLDDTIDECKVEKSSFVLRFASSHIMTFIVYKHNTRKLVSIEKDIINVLRYHRLSPGTPLAMWQHFPDSHHFQFKHVNSYPEISLLNNQFVLY